MVNTFNNSTAINSGIEGNNILRKNTYKSKNKRIKSINYQDFPYTAKIMNNSDKLKQSYVLKKDSLTKINLILNSDNKANNEKEEKFINYVNLVKENFDSKGRLKNDLITSNLEYLGSIVEGKWTTLEEFIKDNIISKKLIINYY